MLRTSCDVSSRADMSGAEAEIIPSLGSAESDELRETGR